MSAELAWFKSSYSGGGGGNCIEVAVSWRKSSYSNSEGSACVEVAVSWRKSSYSSSGGGDCVEVATCPDTVHVRDSKDPDGPHLTFTAATWAAFIGFAAAGDGAA